MRPAVAAVEGAAGARRPAQICSWTFPLRPPSAPTCGDCIQVVRFRALSMSYWRFCLPHGFVGLLSQSAEVRGAALQWLSRVWEALEVAEKAKHNSVALKELLEAAPV